MGATSRSETNAGLLHEASLSGTLSETVQTYAQAACLRIFLSDLSITGDKSISHLWGLAWRPVRLHTTNYRRCGSSGLLGIVCGTLLHCLEGHRMKYLYSFSGDCQKLKLFLGGSAAPRRTKVVCLSIRSLAMHYAHLSRSPRARRSTPSSFHYHVMELQQPP